MEIVLGSGWRVMLHEAVGHGLEGILTAKALRSSQDELARGGRKGVTVVDDGTIADRRGSITIDDEGSASAKMC